MTAIERLSVQLTHALIAAPATPLDAEGRLPADDLDAYARALVDQVDGVCVWAHTGRGLHRTVAERRLILSAFRAATSAPVLAAAGAPPGTEPTFRAERAAAARMAEEAAAGGADGVLVYPVATLRDPSTRDVRTLDLHRAVAEASGLPVLGFLLYERAGGVHYPPALLRELAARPEVVGVKLATLDDAMRCQDAIAAVRAGGALAITGEDRMFGASLMWGADAALVGVAAAAVPLTRAVVESWFAGDYVRFVAASARLDAFAAATFREPMDGYVQRMLWVAAAEGLLPDRSSHDAPAPPLGADERSRVEAAYRTAVQPTRSE